MSAIKIEATIGVNADYNHDNKVITKEEFCKQVMYYIEKCYLKTGISVSFVINESRTCYRTEFGCPENGEVTYTLSATPNPVYVVDQEYYAYLAADIIKKIAKHYGQETVSIIIHKGLELNYYKLDNNKINYVIKGTNEESDYKECPYANLRNEKRRIGCINFDDLTGVCFNIIEQICSRNLYEEEE